MTLRPLWSATEMSLPSASGGLKAGAVSRRGSRSRMDLLRACRRIRSRLMGARDRPGTEKLTDCPSTTDYRYGGSAVSDARTPAQIEADIVRRREQLAVTLDEIG